jgi:hypothetical protein
MSAFDEALENYRSALTAAVVEVKSETERRFLDFLLDGLRNIDERYHQFSDPNMCRILVAAEQHILSALHSTDVDRLKSAYAQLLSTVTPTK